MLVLLLSTKVTSSRLLFLVRRALPRALRPRLIRLLLCRRALRLLLLHRQQCRGRHTPAPPPPSPPPRIHQVAAQH